MDENAIKFSEKLKDLISIAAKKKNVLEYQEINDFFMDMDIDQNQMEKIYEFLEHHNVDVLRISDEDMMLDDEDDEE